jgi:hypothetical protein
MESGHLKVRDDEGRKTLSWIIGKEAVTMEVGLNWLMIVFNGGLRY